MAHIDLQRVVKTLLRSYRGDYERVAIVDEEDEEDTKLITEPEIYDPFFGLAGDEEEMRKALEFNTCTSRDFTSKYLNLANLPNVADIPFAGLTGLKRNRSDISSGAVSPITVAASPITVPVIPLQPAFNIAFICASSDPSLRESYKQNKPEGAASLGLELMRHTIHAASTDHDLFYLQAANRQLIGLYRQDRWGWNAGISPDDGNYQVMKNGKSEDLPHQGDIDDCEVVFNAHNADIEANVRRLNASMYTKKGADFGDGYWMCRTKLGDAETPKTVLSQPLEKAARQYKEFPARFELITPNVGTDLSDLVRSCMGQIDNRYFTKKMEKVVSMGKNVMIIQCTTKKEGRTHVLGFAAGWTIVNPLDNTADDVLASVHANS